MESITHNGITYPVNLFEQMCPPDDGAPLVVIITKSESGGIEIADGSDKLTEEFREFLRTKSPSSSDIDDLKTVVKIIEGQDWLNTNCEFNSKMLNELLEHIDKLPVTFPEYYCDTIINFATSGSSIGLSKTEKFMIYKFVAQRHLYPRDGEMTVEKLMLAIRQPYENMIVKLHWIFWTKLLGLKA